MYQCLVTALLKILGSLWILVQIRRTTIKYHMPTEVHGDSCWDWWCISDILKWWIILDNILNKTKYNHCSIHKKVSVLENSVYNKALKYLTLTITCKIELYGSSEHVQPVFYTARKFETCAGCTTLSYHISNQWNNQTPKTFWNSFPYQQVIQDPPTPEVDTWNHE